MQAFAKLLDRLFFTYSHLEKNDLLKNYFATTKDPERGYTIAIIAGNLVFPTFKRTMIHELMTEKIDPYLFGLSYDYVGDLSETISLLWQPDHLNPATPLPSLTEIITELTRLPKDEMKSYIRDLLNRANTIERWALLKLGTGELRIGVSARFIKQALAQYGNQDIHLIEKLWHGLQPPYTEMFAWLEGKAPEPNLTENIYFHPVMLSHPLEEKDVEIILPELFAVERKYDGIRVQFIFTNKGKALFSRTGDNISAAFPDLLNVSLTEGVILDGELVNKKNDSIGSFNDLQQRLNRKIPSKKLIEDSPAHIILYDILMWNHEDLRSLSFNERRKCLEKWFCENNLSNMSLSEIIPFTSEHNLATIKEEILAAEDVAVEGLMLKRKESLYIAGRPTGQWYKWKRDPYLIDAVLMYAQRGSGKRSSYYSDYTFGLWQNGTLLPIGKAYFGFTDEELKQLDKWIRNHTIARFGPVREVAKELVFEVAFEAVNLSTRHKSGFALRFPRINRIRWDKPASEADQLSILNTFLRQ